jgi:hypothetical protein
VIVSHDAERLATAAAELRSIGPNVEAVQADVADAGSVSRMADKVMAGIGCPDILVNNAGLATYRTFEQMDPSEIELLVSVNFLGALRCTKAFLAAMIARRSGTIVNMASIAGRIPMTPNGTYSAAKHGLVAWSETLRYEVARYGISVSVICPGRVETPFFDHPTFRERVPRRETRQTITLDDVSGATLDAVAHRRFLTYVPRSLGFVVWAINALPLVARPLYRILMSRRVADMYLDEPN